MKFKYTTSIKKLRKLTKRKRVVQGGSSAGKTFGILPILIDVAIKNKKKRISVVSETIPHLRRGAMKDFLDIMSDTGRFFASNWNKTLLTYTFDNGSYVEFFSADQESKLRGARRDILYINEANNIHFEAYYQLSIRTSEYIWMDFNPANEFWAHTEVLKEDDSEHIILTYKDNEALPINVVSDFEQAIKKADSGDPYWINWVKVYVYGEIGNLQGVVFNNWEQVDKMPEQAKLIAYGMDFGFTNDPTTLVACYSFDGCYYFDEILYQRELTNLDIYNMINDKVDLRTMIYADSSEPKSIRELIRLGLNITGAIKGPDSVNFGIDKLQQNKFYVTARSTNLIKELRNYRWKEDKGGAKLNVPVDNHNHIIDAIRYAVISAGKYAGKYMFS